MAAVRAIDLALALYSTRHDTGLATLGVAKSIPPWEQQEPAEAKAAEEAVVAPTP